MSELVEEKIENKKDPVKKTTNKKVTEKKNITKELKNKKEIVKDIDNNEIKSNTEAKNNETKNTKAKATKKTSTRKNANVKKDEDNISKIETPKKTTNKKAETINKKAATKSNNISKTKKDKKNAINKDSKLSDNTEKIDNLQLDKLTDQINEKTEEIVEEKEIEEIGRIIKKETRRKLPEEKLSQIIKQSLCNVLVGIFIVLYFIFLNLGFKNIEKNIFITDLKVFSVTILVIAIFIFEKAYKQESKILAIQGIETLSVAICTVALLYIDIIQSQMFMKSALIMSTVVIVYYLIKLIVNYIFIKIKNDKENNELNTISKEEVE